MKKWKLISHFYSTSEFDNVKVFYSRYILFTFFVNISKKSYFIWWIFKIKVTFSRSFSNIKWKSLNNTYLIKSKQQYQLFPVWGSTKQSHISYAMKPVPSPTRPIRPVHNLTMEIIDTAASIINAGTVHYCSDWCRYLCKILSQSWARDLKNCRVNLQKLLFILI